MRILFLTYNFIAPGQPGSLRAWQIGRHLAAAGHHVTVVACAVNYMVGGKGAASKIRVPEDNGRLQVVEINSPIANPRKSKAHRIAHDIIVAFLQLKVSFTRASNADIILSASPPILTPLTGCLLSLLWRKPNVFEVRDILSDGLVAGGIIRIKGFVALIELLEKTCFQLSRGLIAVTPGIRRLMIKKGVSGDRIKLITNGVEDELYEQVPEKSAARQEWSLKDGFGVVVFTGTLSSFSNIQLLLETACLLAEENIHFLIAGEGQKRSEYERFCHERKLVKVHFIGAVARNRIPSLCAAADVCVHMFKQGEFWDIFFSNKMFDYMGAGRPVVYAGGGDSAVLIRDSKGGLVVEPDNPRALADGILRLISSPEKGKAMGLSARNYVLENYSRKKLMAEMTRYLERVAVDL